MELIPLYAELPQIVIKLIILVCYTRDMEKKNIHNGPSFSNSVLYEQTIISDKKHKVKINHECILKCIYIYMWA